MPMLCAPDPATLTALVGIPYLERGRTTRGADCWGIVLLAARELWGLQLPEYFYSELDLLAEASVLIDIETDETQAHWWEVDSPYPRGAVHVFRIHGKRTHCGLHLGGLDFLH